MFQDEAAEGAAQPGESGNDSGISDAGEHTEAVKDVFDLTLDKMEGIISTTDSTQIITMSLSSMAFSTGLDNQTDPFSLAVFLVPSLTLSLPNVAKGKIQQKFPNFVL